MDNKLKQYVIDSFSTDNSIKKYTQDMYKGLWQSEEILINKYFRPNSRVLDLGCGVGRTTFPLKEKHYDVTGVDITPKFIELALEFCKQKNVQIDFRIGDATNLDFPDNNFDSILFSFNGWSMIPTKLGRLEAAKEIYRVLKPNGYFIFTFHVRKIFGNELLWAIQLFKLYILKPLGYKTNETDLGDFYFKKDSETTYPIKQFVSFLSVNATKKLFEKLGFKVIFSKMRSKFAPKDNALSSGDVIFFVCQKNN